MIRKFLYWVADELIPSIGASLIIIVPIALIVFSSQIGSYFNQATCSVYVDGKKVYEGRQHFVSIRPIGEYGATKKVIIYKDVRRFFKEAVYVSDDVKMLGE